MVPGMCETSTVGPHPPQGTLRGCAYPPPRECTARSRACSPSRRRQDASHPDLRAPHPRILALPRHRRIVRRRCRNELGVPRGSPRPRPLQPRQPPPRPNPPKRRVATRPTPSTPPPRTSATSPWRTPSHTSRPGTSDSPRLSRKPASSLASPSARPLAPPRASPTAHFVPSRAPSSSNNSTAPPRPPSSPVSSPSPPPTPIPLGSPRLGSSPLTKPPCARAASPSVNSNISVGSPSPSRPRTRSKAAADSTTKP